MEILNRSEASNKKLLSELEQAITTSSILCVTDTEGIITYVNEPFCQISHYRPEELLGKTHRIINSGFHPDSFFKGLWETICCGNTWHGEIKNRAKDGSYYWLDTTITPFMNSEGEPYQHVAIQHDITEQKKIQEDLRLLNEELEAKVVVRTIELADSLQRLHQSEQLKERFSAALTHDMRNPLLGQRNALELVKKLSTEVSGELKEIITVMEESNSDLLEIVNKLLEVYQLSSGGTQLSSSRLRLSELVVDCMQGISLVAKEKQISLKNTVPDDLICYGDSFHLKRLFTNLIGNALAHIPAGSQIEITASDHKNFTEIQVSDNGPGLPEELIPSLFEIYSKRKVQYLGSGLGLSICKMIVDLHKGRITVGSQPGQGTKFIIQLPNN